jgi:pimeloyl-ACP methyl ester carboxylesterase
MYPLSKNGVGMMALRCVLFRSSTRPVSDLRRAWELKLSNGVVAEFLGGSPEEVPDRYKSASPVESLPLRVPLKLFHGTADTSVPFELSRRFAAAASAHGDEAELITLDGSGHFEMVDPRTTEFGRVRDAVRSLRACLCSNAADAAGI